MALTKDQILSCVDRPIPVNVPEWGGTVYVRTFNGRERGQFEYLCLKVQKAIEAQSPDMGATASHYRAWVICHAVCDESGKRLFADDDLDRCMEMNGRAQVRIFNAAIDASKLDTESLKVVEGNFESAPSKGSGSN